MPSISFPSHLRRIFRSRKAGVLITVAFFLVLACAILQPFAGPREKLVGSWLVRCIHSSADMFAPTPLSNVCIIVFTADGKMHAAERLDINGKVGREGNLWTYTWLDDSTILIHSVLSIDAGEKVSVHFEGWGPWLKLTMQSQYTFAPSESMFKYGGWGCFWPGCMQYPQ